MIDLGNNPIGTRPTLFERNQIKLSLNIFPSPVALGPIAANFNTSLFNIQNTFAMGNNICYANDPSSIYSLNLTGTNLAGRLNFTDLNNLTGINFASNQLTDVNLYGCSGLSGVFLQNNNLNTGKIDNILATLNSFNSYSGKINLTGANNSKPSPSGLLYKASLQSRSWTVDTTP